MSRKEINPAMVILARESRGLTQVNLARGVGVTQAWQTIQTFSGSGNQKTSVFSVSDNWRIEWSCTPDPSANSIGGYLFSVNVDNSDTSMADLDALSGSCKPGNTQLTTNEHQAGNVYLDVISGSGPWTITVQEMK